VWTRTGGGIPSCGGGICTKIGGIRQGCGIRVGEPKAGTHPTVPDGSTSSHRGGQFIGTRKRGGQDSADRDPFLDVNVVDGM